MVRPCRFALSLLVLARVALHAQAPAPLAATPALSPGAGTPAPATAAKPRTPRAISPEVAAQLAASRPKFAPVAPPPPKPDEDLPDMREVDKPKNTIVRLPKYVVQEQRPPVFTEREIHTQAGLARLAMGRYLTETDRALNRFRLPLFGISNEDRALAMFAEDERLQNMNEIADRTNMVMKSDPAAGKKMQDASRQTFMRWQDFGWQGPTK